MNSISFSPSLHTFTQKHGTKSRSQCVLSLMRNFDAPKSNQFPTSKCKMQPMYTKPLLVTAQRGRKNADQQPNSMAPSPLLDLVHEFYTHLNSKDVRRMEKLFDPNCVIEDEAYYQPLEGKKIHEFFDKLTKAMGQHVVFAIDRICKGDESNIAVMWHLEWNGEVIPFTRGCSFYTISNNNRTFLIRRVDIFVEAPFKPGDFALETLKIIISLFDRFPELAQSLLRKPDAMVYYLIKAYQFIVEPLLLSFIMYTTRMLIQAAKILARLFIILNNIFRLFF